MKYKQILFFVIIMCLGTTFLYAQGSEKNVNVRNPELRREILEMLQKDQAIIKEIKDKRVKSGSITTSPEDEERLRALKDANTNRVKQIVRQYGYPTKELIGQDGVNALNILVLHATHDTDFQTEYLELVRKAVENKQIPGRAFAYLTDKIRMSTGKPQLYGTQALGDGKGNIEPYPIEDAGNVDKRRAALEMETLEEYLNLVRRLDNEQTERVYKESISDLLREVNQARKNNDSEKLNQLLAPDYVEVSPFGEINSR